jgi:hypothetical protein
MNLKILAVALLLGAGATLAQAPAHAQAPARLSPRRRTSR